MYNNILLFTLALCTFYMLPANASGDEERGSSARIVRESPPTISRIDPKGKNALDIQRRLFSQKIKRKK